MVRTRFAPSPTGYLHIGGVRTALFCWLFARRHGGRFILRIDDTDQQRNVDEALAPILDGLRWLGIDWDEGPEVGGPHAPYYQSQRLDRYRAAVEELLSGGFAYALTSVQVDPYPTRTFRSPVWGIFAPRSDTGMSFRVIGIHAHWRDAHIREEEGKWLATYVSGLLDNPNDTDQIILLGDYNGEVPKAPHDGLVAGGDLRIVPKRNGDATAVNGRSKIDHIYVTEAAQRHLSEPTAFVIRPEHYGETGAAFRQTYSDHLPVFVDYKISPPAVQSRSSTPN